MALAHWWQEQPKPLLQPMVCAQGNWEPPPHIHLRLPCCAPAEGGTNSWENKRGSPGQVQKFTFLVGEEVQTHNSHMPIHQHHKENFSRTLIAQNIWGFLRGFCLLFSREFFSSFLVGKLMPLIL